MLSQLILAVAASGLAAAAPTTSFAAANATSSSNSTNTPLNVTVSDVLQAEGFTSAEWIAALQRAREIVGNMTLAEKVNFTDHPSDTMGCAARTFPIERFNITTMCYGDGPTGVNSRYSTQFPSQLTAAATWDVELFASRAEAMAAEMKAVGIHIPLAIVAGGPMGRSPYGGRNWENFSPDPYLTGVATRLSVEGFQKYNVHGHIKHFLGNEQEYLRIGADFGGYRGGKANQTLNSIIDPATTREVYAWAFAEGVRAGAASVMCAYTQVDGALACESEDALKNLLKEELNAHSSVVSDWGAVISGNKAAVNGTDIIQPRTLWGLTMLAQIENGTFPADILDDKIVRQITPYFALNQSTLPTPDYMRYVATKESKANVLAVAEASITLLKNIRSTNDTRGLPLANATDILLVGDSASTGPYGMLSNIGNLMVYNTVNANSSYSWEEAKGYVTDGWGSGGSPAPFIVDPFEGMKARAQKEAEAGRRPPIVDGYFNNNPLAGITKLPAPGSMNSSFLDYKLSYSTQAVVFVGTSAMEGYDRVDLKLANSGDELIDYVASRHNDTIVVVHAPGPVDMSAWAEHENVTSIVMTYFPTTEGGNAIASVLFGDISPSGKLPFTIARNASDYPKALYDGPIAINPIANFTEGTLIDYRYFDAKNITPMFEFGFGMSYTSFTFSDLNIAATPEKQRALVRETNEKLVGSNGTVGLYDVAYTVTATVANTGSIAGAEVAQLYLTIPNWSSYGMPLRSLRGFSKPSLSPGASQTVEFKLRNKDVAYWSPSEEGWVVPEGNFTVSVGSSSRMLPLVGSFTR